MKNTQFLSFSHSSGSWVSVAVLTAWEIESQSLNEVVSRCHMSHPKWGCRPVATWFPAPSFTSQQITGNLNNDFKLLKCWHDLMHGGHIPCSGGHGLLLTQIFPIFSVYHPWHQDVKQKTEEAPQPPATLPCWSTLPYPRAKSHDHKRLQMLAEQQGSLQLNRAIHKGGKILLALINCNFQD